MEKHTRKRGRPKSFHDKSAENRIQSLDRAFDVLDSIATGGGLTLSEIADQLGQSPATIYRILTTLAARGALEMDAASQEWHIGPSSFRMGSAFLKRSGIAERARPAMRSLMVETGETANLGIEANGQVLFLSQVETHESIRAFFPPGTQSPMHASGIGKALLAYAPDARIDAYLSGGNLAVFTENTIADKTALRAELAKIRSQGFAFDNEEKSKGMRCVAAPILNNFGEVVAGISISGPSARLTLAQIADVSVVVVDQARKLSLALGFQG